MRPIIIFIALIVLVLAGCAANMTPYGNFANGTEAVNQNIAADAVNQIVSIYPPANTRLELRQPTPDTFGIDLVRGLREQGYALLEFNPEDQQPDPDGQPLHYVLDKVDLNLYRLTILVGSQSITRPYLDKNGSIVPAGCWVHKE
ncbi:MAG: conjugal transfer protein TrbH [Desulfuromusa sp.]|nr:conjugal transfer protein TrbH [Desulfuromusa sp.]